MLDRSKGMMMRGAALMALGLLLQLGVARADEGQMPVQTAQAPPPAATPAPPPPPPPPSHGLEEIVVTAEHREEDISKVPMSITALTGDQMEQQGIKNVADVAREVPGLNFQAASDSFGTTQIAIRGISSIAGSATTGVYIDDTPIQVRPSGATGTTTPYPKVFDLDRVEVLKGPQGTLFGAGSEGGTVRFITPDPSLDNFSGVVHADGSFTVDGDPSWETGVAIGGPIVEGKLGFRASAWVQEEGGWVDRANPENNQVVDANSNWDISKVARLALKWQPIDNLIIQPSVYYQDVYTNDTSLYSLAEPCVDVSAHCQVQTVGGQFKNLSLIPQPDDDHFFLNGLTMGYDFDAFTVKSITSWFHRTDKRLSDASTYDLSGFVPWPLNQYNTDGGQYLPDGAPFVSHIQLENGQENYDEEIRITSNDAPDDPLSWSAGLYWQHNRQTLDYSIREPLINVANDPTVIGYYGLGCAPGSCTVADLMGSNMVGPYSYLDFSVSHEQEEAAYANVSYKFLDNKLKLEAGVRAARSLFDFYDEQNGPWTAGYHVNSATKKEYPVTPRYSISYQLTDDQLIYATAAKGYRIGGGNDDLSHFVSCAGDFANLGIKGDPLTYDSDSVWSYEAGTKSKFFGNKVQIDAAAFWIDWTNIQSEVYLPICGYNYTQNLGNAVSRGFELSATWLVSDALTLTANVGYSDAHYTTTTTVGSAAPVILAHAGDPLPVPPFTFTVSAEHDQDLGNDMSLYVRTDFTFASPYTRTGGPLTYSYDPEVRAGASTIDLTARAGVTKGPWDVSVYGQNLTNSTTSQYLFHDTGTAPNIRAESPRPLTLGMTVDYKF
jgi:iron complex outermembrane receptor protein